MAEMARFVFITGGVVSSLGKGLAAAALGALLKSRGYKVRLRKFDPYLNVDPGTMSPFEHGEVFVTDDGAETDLDLGHYERFTGVAATKDDSVSAGRIYEEVLRKERKGDDRPRSGRSTYFGKTIQVIPHVTDEIKNFVEKGEEDVDFMLCEIGGTVGDIEGLPFLEAIRQFSQGKHRGLCVFVHLTLLPYLSTTRELKTKPTQHSVKELRSIGISPDVILCRFEMENQDPERPQLPDPERGKISLFCGVPKENVISAPNFKTIYDAPLAYHGEGFDKAVLDSFRKLDKLYKDAPEPNKELKKPGPIVDKEPCLIEWNEVREKIRNPEFKVYVAIVGKYTRLEDAYKSLSEALTHAGMANQAAVIPKWISAEIFEEEDIENHLQSIHAIIVPGGFDERGTEGMIKAAQYAREKGVPFLGICLGMQIAVIEVARNVAGITAAGSAEFNEESGNPKFEPVVCHIDNWIKDDDTVKSMATDAKGGTMRLGSVEALLKEGTKIYDIYGNSVIHERHRHRYEVNKDYINLLNESGLEISGVSRKGSLPEVIEWPNHRWFIGVQFHPELKSRPSDPHPIFVDLIGNAIRDLLTTRHRK